MGEEYKVSVDGVTFTVKVKKINGGTLELIVNGEKVNCKFKETEEASLIHLEGKEIPVKVTNKGKNSFLVEIYGLRYPVEVVKPVKEEIKEETGLTVLRAPMSGRVASVNVGKGEKVNRGSLLLTIESMKMVNEIKAPRKGEVKEVKVKPGHFVNQGDSLLVID